MLSESCDKPSLPRTSTGIIGATQPAILNVNMMEQNAAAIVFCINDKMRTVLLKYYNENWFFLGG